MEHAGDLSTLLRCPDCMAPLTQATNASAATITCNGCARAFPLNSGIAILHPLTIPAPSTEDIRAWDEPASGRIEHLADWRALLAKEAQIRDFTSLLSSRDWSSKTVVEVGGGMCWGSLTVKQLFPRAHVIATDVAPSALTIARSIAATLSLQADRYIAVDSHHLPFADSSVDVIFGSEMLHHLEAPEIALREIRRVLRPGGEYLGIGEGAASGPVKWLLETSGLHRRLGGHEASRYNMKEALYSLTQWQHFFLQSGFDSVRLLPATNPTLHYQGLLRLYYYCALHLLPRAIRPHLGCALHIEASVYMPWPAT